MAGALSASIASLLLSAANVDQTVDLVNDGTAWRNEASGASSTIAATVSGIATGALVVVQVKCETNTQISSCTSSAGGTWTRVVHLNFSNNDGWGAVFVCLSAPAGMTSITATFASGAATFRKINVTEQACNTPPTVGNSAIAAGSSTAPNSGNITTSGTGFVLGFYWNYNSVAVTGPLNGARTGWNSPEVNTTFMQAWGTQRRAANETIAASCTLGSSGVWLCAAIEIRGSGARTATTSNYAHGYMNFSALADTTLLTTTNLAAALTGQGAVAAEFAVTTTTTNNLTASANEFTKGKPLVVLGSSIATGTASKPFGVAHVAANAPNYWSKTVNRHKRARVMGFLHLGPTNGGNTSLFDLVSIKGLTAILNIIQLNCTNADPNDYNLGVEAIVSGSPNHSTGFTPTSQGSYTYCFDVDTQASVSKLWVWDSSNVQVLADTPAIDASHEDLTVLRFGNAEAGVEALRRTVFEHTCWNYDYDESTPVNLNAT